MTFTSNFAALAWVDPAKGAVCVRREVTLAPGFRFTGTLLAPDGSPLTGAWSFGVKFLPSDRDGMKTAEFTVDRFNPSRPRDIIFQHLEKRLVGVAKPPKENGAWITVQMEPGAAITGRLVDEEGHPRAGAELELRFRPKGEPYWTSCHPSTVKTDHEGRVRLEALLPGKEFRLSDDKRQLRLGLAPASGQTKDLGDVRLKAKK